ncbi:hypothetical protein V8G54_012705 [Vigna mungo]|uniref:Uncharacterized protein n=1 Tax=Vigna mungo TaxID=3915 RepID=A0AAQ3S4A1_VIGMU
MKSFVEAMQQQNASLVQQNNVISQRLGVARMSAQTSQLQYLMAMHQLNGTRATAGLSQVQEWSLESFLQYRPAKFNGKKSPNEVDQWMRDMERIFMLRGAQ